MLPLCSLPQCGGVKSSILSTYSSHFGLQNTKLKVLAVSLTTAVLNCKQFCRILKSCFVPASATEHSEASHGQAAADRLLNSVVGCRIVRWQVARCHGLNVCVP